MTDDIMSYYDKTGKPITPAEFFGLKWDSAGSVSDYAKVAFDQLDHCAISTVWLGLNHNFYDGPPLIFESMVFGGASDGDMRRYATEDEALAGHRRAVERMRAGDAPW